MNIFATKQNPDSQDIYHVSEENFKRATSMKFPYVQGEQYYAICPRCNNPISFVALFKKERKVSPYARHHQGDVYSLAEYDEQAYKYCPLANPDNKSSDAKRPYRNKQALYLYDLMRDYFDVVVSFVSKEIGIYISKDFSKRLLEHFVQDEGWYYYEVNNGNLPFQLFRSFGTSTLHGRLLYIGSDIYDVMKEYCEEPRHGKAKVRLRSYIDDTFEFIIIRNDNSMVVDGTPHEIFSLVVLKNNEAFWEKKIPVDNMAFMEMIREIKQRNKEFLKIAEELMPEIPE